MPNEGLNLIPVTGNTTINAPVPAGFVGSLPGSMAVSGSTTREIPRSRNVSLSKAFSQAPGLAISTPKLIQPVDAVSKSRYTDVKNRISETDEEGFIDALKQATSLVAPILGPAVGTILPVALGPIGGPISALLSGALNAAGKLCESAVTEGAPADAQTAQQGSIERAILAEATLTALQSMELSPDVEESLFTDMRDTVMKALPTVRKAAPQVLGAMMEPALRLALNSLHNYNATAATGAESLEATTAKQFRSNVVYTNVIDQPTGRQGEQFLDLLQASLERNKEESAMDDDSAESLIDVLRAGLRIGGQGISIAAKVGLPLLLQGLSSGAESIEEGPAADESRVLSADALAHRAVVAEAALQAVMKQSPQYLQEEGFFDGLINGIQRIAPVVMPILPDVFSAVTPIVGGVLKKVVGQESTMAGNAADQSVTPRANRLGSAAPPLRAPRSLASLRQQGNAPSANGVTYEGFGQKNNASRGAFRQNVNFSRPAF